MASLYRTTRNGVTYEVRTAGASLRLYSNEAFHTQYNPNHLFSGAVWDLLALPALMREQFPQKVLVLGVGGGAVINQLKELGAPDSTIGIELDPVHIRIAKRFFGLSREGVTLIESDARDWLYANRECHDYIIDDVFLHGDSNPARPFPVTADWNETLASRLNTDGVLIQNHIDPKQLKHSRDHLRSHFDALFQFTTEGYDNHILACFKHRAGSDTKGYKRRLSDALARLPRARTRRLRYRCVQMK